MFLHQEPTTLKGALAIEVQLSGTVLPAVLGRFPFVRTDRPANCHRNENLTFNQNLLSTSVKS